MVERERQELRSCFPDCSFVLLDVEDVNKNMIVGPQ